MLALALHMAFGHASVPAGLADLSLEELGNIEITSVSRHAERLSDAAAAIFVITGEDIRRSGATTLPEALRLAPNLEVARTSSNAYAISARGLNINSANKLLVLIDGRSVYTPLDSGVFWDAQDVMLEDVERIEVISGPGGTLWGSNAVNGVINIITRRAAETQGALVSAGGGNQESGLAARYGAKLGEDASLRLYAKGFHDDSTRNAAGRSLHDSWFRQQGGFRTDWGRADNGFTLQGDAYDGEYDQPATPDNRTRSGANLLGRWNRTLDGGASFEIQAYYDLVKQTVPGFSGFSETDDTYDIQAQYHFLAGDRHEIVWGGGYRMWRDNVTNGPLIAFLPTHFDLKLANVFAQDSIALDPHFKLTLGAKIEHNSYTGSEFQPNIRLAWKPNERDLLWSAASRAVRTPSRVDRDFYIFNFPALPLRGQSAFRSEKLTSYELGYRGQPSPVLSYSVNLFYNVYDDLRSIEPASPGSPLLVIGNKIEGHTDGLEMWGSYRVNERWRLAAGFNTLHEQFRFKSGSRQSVAFGSATASSSNDPAQQFFLRSTLDLPWDIELDAGLRRIGALTNPTVPAYTAVDVRCGWRPRKDVDVSLIGRNLLDHRHVETGAGPASSEIESSIYLKLTWLY